MDTEQLGTLADKVLKLADQMEDVHNQIKDEKIARGNLKIAIMAGILDGYMKGLKKATDDKVELLKQINDEVK